MTRLSDLRRPAGLFALLTFLWAADAALGWGTFAVHDLHHHHVPWRVWAAGEWMAGRVPTWAPQVAAGFPLMADGQAGVFYLPTMLLFALLPAAWALNATVLVHVLWAGLGAQVLGRGLGLRGPGARVMGVAYAFSGFLATHVIYLGMHAGLAWLPWLLAAVLARRWAGTALCAALMLVAGHPQAAAFGLLFAGALALREAWAVGRPRQLLGFTLAMLGAAAMASPQILATLELSGEGMRSGGVADIFANIGSLPPQELVGALFPEAFGMERPGDIALTHDHRGLGYWGQGENHWEMAFFVGLPVAVLAGLGARGRRFWVLMAGASLLLMLGGLMLGLSAYSNLFGGSEAAETQAGETAESINSAGGDLSEQDVMNVFEIVRGEFKTTRLREDKWGYPILEDEKREENRTPYCGGARMEN